MKVERDKAWWLGKALLEAGEHVGAGVPDDMENLAVYQGTTEYPGKIVVRLWLIRRGAEEPVMTRQVWLYDTVEQARAVITKNPNMTCFPRHPLDNPSLVEVWM